MSKIVWSWSCPYGGSVGAELSDFDIGKVEQCELYFNGRIEINGSGDQGRSFIHVDKLARLVTGAVDHNYHLGLYNAVEHNLTVNEVAGYIRSLYPALETIHVNFNLKLRSIQTKLPCKLTELMALSQSSFEKELSHFKSQFSF